MKKTARKLSVSILIIILLLIALGVTSFALIYATVSVNNNLFHTGYVKINLNDGEAVIREDEFLFEPGMTVEKDFFIENESTWDVWYKIYLENVSGDLADTVQISILDRDELLCTGTALELDGKTVQPAQDSLAIGERKDLTIRFYFPPQEGNEEQDIELKFALRADAVQTKNNPHKLFS